MQLRPYQVEAVRRLRREFANGANAVILVMPTGAGKTVVASEIVKKAVAKGSKVLFLAHRTELIEQCAAKLRELDILFGIIKAGYPTTITAPVQIASVQSLARRETFPPDIIVVDECHHTMAATYRNILNRFPNAITIGLTATPARTDGKGLGDVFDGMVVATTYDELLSGGFLVPFRVFSPSKLDMTGVRTVAGDFSKRQVAEIVQSSKLYGDITGTWKRTASDRRTLLFAASVQHSQDLVAAFQAEGIRADHVDGTTPVEERACLFREIQTGNLQVLSNVGVATEGTDLPAISCVILANPTKSIVLHQQMVGRGLRPAPGKRDLIILDHAGNHTRNGFVNEPIEWGLEGTSKTSGDKREKVPQVRVCPQCFLCLPGGTLDCPSCNYHWKVEGRNPKLVSDTLREITSITRPPTEKRPYRTNLDPLEYYLKQYKTAVEKGYRTGWAKYKFKIVFEEWPRWRDAEMNRMLEES